MFAELAPSKGIDAAAKTDPRITKKNTRRFQGAADDFDNAKRTHNLAAITLVSDDSDGRRKKKKNHP